MYAKHATAIQTWAKKSPDHLARVLQFCIVTAHQPFFNASADMQIAVEGGHDAARVLFGWKAAAFSEVWEKREAIAWNCNDITLRLHRRRDRADAMLIYLSSLHGLGLAKAAFAMQLAYGLSGCLDTHNLARLGYGPRAFRLHKEATTRRSTIARCVARYNAVVYRAGGTEKLWNSWCKYVAVKYPRRYSTAFEVSAIHTQALGLCDA